MLHPVYVAREESLGRRRPPVSCEHARSIQHQAPVGWLGDLLGDFASG